MVQARTTKDAIAVILDFVEPFRAGGNDLAGGEGAELKRLKHAPNIGARGFGPA